MDNREWGVLLAKNFHALSLRREPRRIRSPEHGELKLGGNTSQLTIELGPKAVNELNMQTPSGAFDGWLWVIRHWCGVRSFRIDLRPEVALEATHAGRFVFRLRKLRELLRDELIFGERLRQALDDYQSWRPERPVWLNVGRSGRGPKTLPMILARESDLELALCYDDDLSRELALHFRLITRPHPRSSEPVLALCRQFPVGVFTSDPAHSGWQSLCPKGKSAIDLVGVDENGALHIFELKKPGTIAVGALSELFFYATLMHDARRKDRHVHFSTAKPDNEARVLPSDVENATEIRAHLLVPDIHPLLVPGLFSEITRLANQAGWKLSIDARDLYREVASIACRLPRKAVIEAGA